MLGNEFSSTNSDDKQRVVNQGNEWTQKMWESKYKITYIRPSIYDIYNNISLIFCVVPDSVSLAANYCIYNYHGWALYVCVCVFAWLLTSFSYSTTALHFIMWCQEWFSLRQLLAVLTLGMMFQPSWLEAVVLVAGPISFLPNHSYMVLFYLV